MRISHFTGLLISIFLLTSCNTRGPEEPAIGKTTMSEVIAPSGTAPILRSSPPPSMDSVQQAVLKAISLSSDMRLFHHAVVIDGSRKADGSILVRFSRPTINSDEMSSKAGGKSLLDVTVRSASVITKPPSAKANKRMYSKRDKSESVRFSKAALAACTYYFKNDLQKGNMKFELIIHEERSGFLVGMKRIPYTPGGYTVFKLSDSFVVIRTIPGR